MPKPTVALYREGDRSCPFIEWFDKSPAKVQGNFHLRLERLREMGHERRRPEADFLRDGIYVKERVVPPKEIDRAVERKN